MPDLAIVEGQPKNYAKRHPTTAELVVEVSDTTLKLDLGDKAELYAAAGIADYWVIDVSNRYLIVHRDPDAEAEAYRSVARFGLGDTVAPLAVPDRPIAVADLLPESP
jgi:Uma2 family endonuclease